ncbi:MAG: YdiU family protein [Prochloraceae cyanobacterium]|nr:YdiU family protein [Prochloraceae cyanobacterium]
MTQAKPNPFLTLNYEIVMEELGDDYYDKVPAAEFPQHILRFRNDRLLPLLNLDRQSVSDRDFIEAFGQFQGVRPFLALRYHGYQFGQYNPYLGDGRGFLYGQVRAADGSIYDFGTKGSGRTPYSRTADGRLTLKGGVREVLAAEVLHQLGVKTSRCLSLIETGESLWRGDEPSPTRSSVMIRFSLSHIRFGTFERLHFIQRPDLIKKLLDYVIAHYYPTIPNCEEKYAKFYAELVERIAKLAAQWMAAGFCHGVLNTDNMSITGESFDYGPYAFIPNYNPQFTAAYFDYGGRYSYGNQPFMCKLNLEMLQQPLMAVISPRDLETGLAQFEDYYWQSYCQLMLKKLGFNKLPIENVSELIKVTIKLLRNNDIPYHGFFFELREGFNYGWREDSSTILENASFSNQVDENWRNLYHQALNKLPIEEMEEIGDRLRFHNPKTALLRPVIESVWEPIDRKDNWEPFYELLRKILAKE